MFLLDSLTELPTKLDLIQDKIQPPPARFRISRPRLKRLLDESLSSCAATVIYGRAGTGKTSLAKDFSENCQREVCWYKVDAPDGEQKIFFQYLVTSIRQHRPEFGFQTLAVLESSCSDTTPLVAEALIFELSSESKPLLVVIEDLHLICDSEWLVPFMCRLLPLLPSEVHLLITSRTLPPAPLWRMRSKQTLRVIGEDALAFTRSEASELFETYKLTNEQASIALDHTKGRAAPLAAVAAELSGCKNAPL